MWGAIIGDIAGSVYEGRGKKIKTKDFDFFKPYCRYTDDTVCTAAVAEILLDDLPADSTLQRWCRRHHGRGYGGRFRRWRDSANPAPYQSFGNGAAMRVSPAAFLNRKRPIDDALAASDGATEVTHDHPEGLKGARATTLAVWLALQGRRPLEIRAEIEREFGYDLSRSVDEIRPGYRFDVTCQGTVPEAITCALESESFEDAVRNAISLGGDSDTLAAIAGPVAEAMHGIPRDMIETARTAYLSDAADIVRVMRRMREAASR